MGAVEQIAVGAFFGATAMIVAMALWSVTGRYRRPAWRWIRWTFRCRRGRRCARLTTQRLQAPPGSIARIEYDCSACGTRYRSETTLVGEADWVETDRERVR